MNKKTLPSMVILISGNGSNLQSIINWVQQYNVATIDAVISNKVNALGLSRAKNANIQTEILEMIPGQSRVEYDEDLSDIIERYQPDLIVLAGFMRILSELFVEKYLGKLINIHPALLPKFKGLNTHQRAIDAKQKEHGASVHFVTPEMDEGPNIIQAKVSVLLDDCAEKLADRVLQQEHLIYPIAIQWCLQQKIRFMDGKVFYNNQPLLQPISYDPVIHRL